MIFVNIFGYENLIVELFFENKFNTFVYYTNVFLPIIRYITGHISD